MPSASPLTLEALEVLDAIDRKGSFAAAAISLNRVPSAISYTVQKLEQDLGITLFQRQGRKSVLTRAGQHLVHQGRDLLIAARELTASTQQVATGWEPKLRIVQDHLLDDAFLLPLVDKLYRLQPGVEIEISQEVLAGTWESLLENRADLAVGAVEGTMRPQGLRILPWKQQAMIYVCSPQHPAASLSAPIDAEALRSFSSVIVRDSSRNLPTLTRGMINRRQRIYVPNMTMKIAAHIAGVGVGTVPRDRVRQALQNGQLIELQLRESQHTTATFLAWKTSNRGQALKWFAEQLMTLDVATPSDATEDK